MKFTRFLIAFAIFLFVTVVGPRFLMSSTLAQTPPQTVVYVDWQSSNTGAASASNIGDS